MQADTMLLAALPAIAGFIALPAFIALCRRRATHEASAVAAALVEFAAAVRRGSGTRASDHELDPALAARVERLGIPELVTLRLAQELPHARADLLADTAQRLALRLKRRIAFERKMLARTASGRRRGALVSAIAPVVLLAIHALGFVMPVGALVSVVCLEACGCFLLWRLTRVGI
jgi:hypothetical protein